MSRRHDRQPGGHCLQNRIRHAFLILVWRYFARMQEQMAAAIELHQLQLREKAKKVHIAGNSQSAGEHFQFVLQWSFSSDKKLRARIIFFEHRKSAKARGDAFLRNQSARLDDFPFAVTRRLSIYEWK